MNSKTVRASDASLDSLAFKLLCAVRIEQKFMSDTGQEKVHLAVGSCKTLTSHFLAHLSADQLEQMIDILSISIPQCNNFLIFCWKTRIHEIALRMSIIDAK